MTDALHLRGLRAYGYTGLLPEEQRLGQWFEVELTLWLDLAQPPPATRSPIPLTTPRLQLPYSN